MGSSQSKPTSTNQKDNLTSPERAFLHCKTEKRAFQRCYSKWWSTSVAFDKKGKGDNNEVSSKRLDRSDCDELFQTYQDCVLEYLEKERGEQEDSQ